MKINWWKLLKILKNFQGSWGKSINQSHDKTNLLSICKFVVCSPPRQFMICSSNPVQASKWLLFLLSASFPGRSPEQGNYFSTCRFINLGLITCKKTDLDFGRHYLQKLKSLKTTLLWRRFLKWLRGSEIYQYTNWLIRRRILMNLKVLWLLLR